MIPKGGHVCKLGVQLKDVPLRPLYREFLDYKSKGGCRGGRKLQPTTRRQWMFLFKALEVCRQQLEITQETEEFTVKDILQIKSHLMDKNYENSYVNRVLEIISVFYSYLFLFEAIDLEQQSRIRRVPKLAQNERVDDAITSKEWDILFEYIRKFSKYWIRNTLYYKILLWTPRRATEPLYCTWEDFDFVKKQIRFPMTKGDRGEELSKMHPEVEYWAKVYAEQIAERLPEGREGEVIGQDQDREPLSFNGMVFQVGYSAFRRLLQRGQKQYPELKRIYQHLTRASYVTDASDEGMDSQVIKREGGWKTNVFEKYIRKIPKARDKQTGEFFDKRFGGRVAETAKGGA